MGGEYISIATGDLVTYNPQNPVFGNRYVWTAATDVRYAYDLVGRLSAVTAVRLAGTALSAPQAAEYGYDVAGNVLTVRRLAGAAQVAVTTHTYDAMNRVATITHATGPGTGVAQSVLTYARYADGDVKSATEARRTAAGGTDTYVTGYEYDALDRLTRETYDGPGSAADFASVYTLDLVGNRLSRVTVRAGVTEADGSVYNALDQLTRHTRAVGGGPAAVTDTTYDRAGAVLTEATAGGPARTNAYDARGRLVGVTLTDGAGGRTEGRYTYDDMGMRVRADVDTFQGPTPTGLDDRAFLADRLNPTGWAQVFEEALAGAAGPDAAYVYGLRPLLEADAGGAVRLLLADQLGSTRLVLDGTGAVAAWVDYDAFGEVLPGSAAGAAAVVHLYAGEYRDAVRGGYDLRARVYDPARGRFTSQDPFAGAAGMPQSFHKYAYVHGDPVNGTDPSGMFEGLTGLMANMGSRSAMLGKKVNSYRHVFDKVYRNSVGMIMTMNWAYAMLDDRLQPSILAATPYNMKLIKAVQGKRGGSDLKKYKNAVLAMIRLAANQGLDAALAGTSQTRKRLTITFKPTGFPDFTDHRMGVSEKYVDKDPAKSKDGFTYFKLTGYRSSRTGGKKRNDNAMANKQTRHVFTLDHRDGPGTHPDRGRYTQTWTWHHHEVPGLMELVYTDIHRRFGHDGGVNFYELATGKTYDVKRRK